LSDVLLTCILVAAPLVFICAWRYPIQTFIWSMVILPVWFAPAIPGSGGLNLYPPCAIALVGIASVIFRQRADIRIGAPVVALVGALFLALVVGGYVLGGIASMSVVPIAFWALPFVFGLVAQCEQNFSAKILDSIRLGGLVLAVFGMVETLANGTSRCAMAGADAGVLLRRGKIAAEGVTQSDLVTEKASETCFYFAKFIPVLNSAGSLQDAQSRGGMLRAEVTWGHSIALSGILAAALYLWLTSRSRFRYPAAVICGATVLLSGSRSGLLCVGIAVGLAILQWSYGSATRQLVLPALFAAVGVSAYAIYSMQDVQTQNDYSGSSTVRERLISAALNGSNLWGPADQYRISDAGVRFMSFEYLDNSLIQTLLGAGWVSAVCLAVLYIAITMKNVGNLRNPMWAILVLQLPGLLSSGFFTQHQMMFWFLVGAACCAQNDPVPKGAARVEPNTLRVGGGVDI
jgi:hypothetical protein